MAELVEMEPAQPTVQSHGLRRQAPNTAGIFDDRAGVTGGHRDTIVYPATPNTTGTIASTPYAAFNIVRSFPCLLTGAGVGASLGCRLGEYVICCRLLRSARAQRKTIARGLMFRAGWM